MDGPSLKEMTDSHKQIRQYIQKTPVWNWRSSRLAQRIGTNTDVHIKLEIFQRTGSFKPRGALVNILSLNPEQRSKGVTAVSAGNHAIGVAYASKALNVSAKLVMPKTVSPIRIDICKSFGAEVVLVDNLKKAYTTVEKIEADEGRYLVHQYEGERTVLGTATVGLEWVRQVPDLEAVIIPLGGGGLCAGISQAIKMINPKCKIYGVEPEGAPIIDSSLKLGSLQSFETVDTIADSLGVLSAQPYTTQLCEQNLDEIFLISDEQMKDAMALLFHSLKLAVEPAGAAATAGLLGPALEHVKGKKVGIIACGTNIDVATFSQLIEGR